MEKDNLEKTRHSLSHLLATAVLEKWPEAKLGIGPTIENGFYYDFYFENPKSEIRNPKQAQNSKSQISETDLKDIEKRMKKLIGGKIDFTKEEISTSEAKELFKDQPFKLELIEELANSSQPSAISIYKSGKFTDLCAGPHVENSKEINADGFKLDKLAGAYWRGSEKNPMLTRIYGLAFSTKEELDTHLKMLEEAEKRDHRKIGKDLDLFTFSQLVGPGLPLWTPKGTILREELNNYVCELRKEKGYQNVTIPHITKPDLYEKSGHWQKFSEELLKIQTREGKTYCLKPMNCPHHTQIYDHIPRSYKDLPQRYAETTMVYRDEQSGELGGLTRVLSITQDDAHVFCRVNQVKQEVISVWEIIDTFYKTFNFKLNVRLSFHDPEKMEKYLGTPEIWERAENEIKEIAESMKADYFMGIGEAAMYGPKLDFMATDALGREHQVATIQLDMNMPERFDLTCINEENQKERIVMIHCAIMGSIERFSAVLIEHLAGHFPLWASPIQVKIVPVSEKFNDYAKEVYEILIENKIRVEISDENETLGKKIRAAEMQKIPYLLVVGEKEVEAKTVAVRHRSKDEGVMSVEEFTQKILEEIKNKK